MDNLLQPAYFTSGLFASPEAVPEARARTAEASANDENAPNKNACRADALTTQLLPFSKSTPPSSPPCAPPHIPPPDGASAPLAERRPSFEMCLAAPAPAAAVPVSAANAARMIDDETHDAWNATVYGDVLSRAVRLAAERSGAATAGASTTAVRACDPLLRALLDRIVAAEVRR